MTEERLEAAERLANLLAHENEALKRFDFPAAVALLPAKQAALADLTKPPAPVMQASAVGRRLIGLAAENQLLLERAIAAQTRIVRIVARASAPPAAVTRYNGYGGRTSSARTAALAVSTRA